MIGLTILLILVLLLALAFVIWPLRHEWKTAGTVAMLVLLTGGLFYQHLGGYQQLSRFHQEKEQHALAKEALKQFKNADEVIDRLRAHLKKEPNSAKGWYLLGRLYASAKQFQPAKDAYQKAYKLNPKDKKIRLEYMQALYITHGAQIKGLTKTILNSLLQEYPNEPDVLNFIAMDAYSHQHYQKAAIYWQKLLRLLPQGSDEHTMILKAIADAQKKR